MRWAMLLAITVAGALALSCGLAGAQSAALEIGGRQAPRTYTQRELLAAPAIRDVTLHDPVYHRTMTYRAIPMPELLKGIAMGADDYVQARAIDNFSVSIPGTFFAASSAAQVEAFLAVEDPAAPWPPIPNKPGKGGAGPFYIIWRLAPRAYVSSEFWAYRLAALTITDSPGQAMARPCHRCRCSRRRSHPHRSRSLRRALHGLPSLQRLGRRRAGPGSRPARWCRRSISRFRRSRS